MVGMKIQVFMIQADQVLYLLDQRIFLFKALHLKVLDQLKITGCGKEEADCGCLHVMML